MLAYVFVVIAIAMRFLPHPLSFTPVGAALLFFGARAPRKMIWVPLALLVASDVYLTTARYGYSLTPDHLVNWAWYLAVLLLSGAFLKRNARPLAIGAAALAVSVSFFVVSNLAVWAVWAMYPKTVAGLIACYVAAIPFFRNEVAGDLFFTAVMFAIPMAIEALRPAAADDHIRAA